MSSALAQYESFLVAHVSTISSLESSLRSITWILPGRFKDAELASEALSALLNVMSMYHDTLLAKVAQTDPKYKPLIPTSPHTRYTRAWCDKDSRYKWAARALELLRFTELLVEMGLRRKVSRSTRWRGIVVLEAIKALLRLVLLRITRRPLLLPSLPEREFDPENIPSGSDTSSPTLAPSSPPSSVLSTPEHLKNNHIPLPVHPLLTPPPPTQSPIPVEEFLLPKALTTASVKAPTSLVKPLASPKEWLSEIIYHVRPLVYAIMLSSGRKDTKPLMTALAMELLALNLRRVPTQSAALERSEYARRDRDIIWYLLRGSLWEGWTKPKLESIAEKTARAPLVGVFGALVKDWIPLIDEYYYYTAP
ncbi:peroxisome membrane protein [Trametes versicolor FP-101664 SS1]|uniref:peroxisome membrane protein n=1 Tax=Trametes versicolor (strain FP-101664) TaxID=717944 RepID=UPI00046217F5|nr:peroxisome membrane protein [Trametes versicolor FP-101664 SS1]EIW64597.1 peroxisome membrane protein [Trametes versicolor FP-101664 SS1]